MITCKTRNGRLTTTELHHDVGIHDRDGADKALQRHGTAAEEPEEDRKGDTESDRTGPHAQCASTSLGIEEELGDKVLVGLELSKICAYQQHSGGVRLIFLGNWIPIP